MIWLLVINIILRICAGLCVVGFGLGLFLYDKHTTWEKIFAYTGFFMILYGFARLFVFAILG